MASRDSSAEMSSGGSQPLSKRQSVRGAPSVFDDMDLDAEGGASQSSTWAPMLSASDAAVNEPGDEIDNEAAAAAVAASVVEAAAGLLGMAQLEGSMQQTGQAKDAAAAVPATVASATVGAGSEPGGHTHYQPTHHSRIRTAPGGYWR